MALNLSYRAETSVPVEIEGFTPDWACGRTVAEIERFEIFHGNEKVSLAEMFLISGDPTDQRIDFEGDLAGVHWIGAHTRAGQIHVHGSAGRNVGSEMRGGEIFVDGDVSIFLGAEMHGGKIHVHGNADHLVGAAYRGSTRGMTAGTILVDGDAGNEVGSSMRRGTIAIAGSVGDAVGFQMIAGTILAFGECGIRPGAGMRRGTIGLFGANPPRLLPSFRYGATYQPQFLRLLLRLLRDQQMEFDNSLLESRYDLYHGDLVSVGRGEILFRHTSG